MNFYNSIKKHEDKVAVVGLGYVGLPLALEFGKVIKTIGFDVNKKRVQSPYREQSISTPIKPWLRRPQRIFRESQVWTTG